MCFGSRKGTVVGCGLCPQPTAMPKELHGSFGVVRMTVVEVGPMGMGVDHPLVPVSVDMARLGGHAVVLVLVMTVVVAMGVDVLQRLVDVLVLVSA